MSDERTPHERMIANLKPAWKKGQSGNPNQINSGRKKSRIKEIEKQDAISSYDRKNVAAYLLEKTIDELNAVLNDPAQPAFVTAVASALIADGKKGITDTWQMLLDWNLGKAEQTINEKVEDVTKKMTDEELNEAIKEEFKKLSKEEIDEIMGGGE
jgi:hypothetical protein